MCMFQIFVFHCLSLSNGDQKMLNLHHVQVRKYRLYPILTLLFRMDGSLLGGSSVNSIVWRGHLGVPCRKRPKARRKVRKMWRWKMRMRKRTRMARMPRKKRRSHHQRPPGPAWDHTSYWQPFHENCWCFILVYIYSLKLETSCAFIFVWFVCSRRVYFYLNKIVHCSSCPWVLWGWFCWKPSPRIWRPSLLASPLEILVSWVECSDPLPSCDVPWNQRSSRHCWRTGCSLEMEFGGG